MKANVTSVSRQTLFPNQSGATALIVLGIACCVVPYFAFDTFLGVIVGIVFIGFGIFQYTQAKTKYSVRIGSASGEADAFMSSDKEEIQKIVDAMNEAIINRK